LRATLAAFVGALALLPHPVAAALGGARASVEADRQALRGEPLPRTSGAGFDVERIDLHGTTLREYVRPDGQVFAVAWEGIAHPDLRVILGASADAWIAARRAAPPSAARAQRRVTAGDVVVETWGHMRHLGGRAIARALVPPGVADEDLR
jgi:hypothetical protein